MKMTLKEMFDKSREQWGLHFQLLMLVEELNELAVATLHLDRKIKNTTAEEIKNNLEKFAEEIADVELLLDEMKYYFQNVSVIAKYRKIKEERLEKLLQNGALKH